MPQYFLIFLKTNCFEILFFLYKKWAPLMELSGSASGVLLYYFLSCGGSHLGYHIHMKKEAV